MRILLMLLSVVLISGCPTTNGKNPNPDPNCFGECEIFKATTRTNFSLTIQGILDADPTTLSTVKQNAAMVRQEIDSNVRSQLSRSDVTYEDLDKMLDKLQQIWRKDLPDTAQQKLDGALRKSMNFNCLPLDKTQTIKTEPSKALICFFEGLYSAFATQQLQ